MKIRNIPFKSESVETAEISKPLSWQLIAATFFGIGLLPKAPGTFGSLAAMIVLLLPQPFILPALIFGIIIGTTVCIFSIPAAEREWGSDAGHIVLDEAVGMWIVLLYPATHQSFKWAFVAFALFRIFDIWKPWPIKYYNDREGAFFVVADDILAAVFALCTMILLGVYFF